MKIMGFADRRIACDCVSARAISLWLGGGGALDLCLWLDNRRGHRLRRYPCPRLGLVPGLASAPTWWSRRGQVSQSLEAVTLPPHALQGPLGTPKVKKSLKIMKIQNFHKNNGFLMNFMISCDFS